MKEFLNFIREQGVIGLAIGFILGGAISKVVASFVNDILQPIVGLIFGSKMGLTAMHIGPVMTGQFVSVVLDFIVLAAVVYFGFKKLHLDKLDRKAEPPKV